MVLPTGIRYVSIQPGTGYGDAAQQYVAGLRAAGVPVRHDLADISRGPAASSDGIDRFPHDTVLCHLRPQDLAPWVDARSDRLHVAYTTWESDRVPGFWREALDRFDLVLVPSAFNQRAIVASGTRAHVEVLPHIARPVAPVAGGPFGDIADGDFVLCTMGPWHNRKALPETISAYLDTFTAADDVALIIKTSDLDYGALAAASAHPAPRGSGHELTTWWSLARLIARYADPPKVYLHRGEALPEVIDQIHTRTDCFFSLTRGEGWGLGSFDAALFGSPPIITGWGGQVEWLPPDHPGLVRYRLAPTTDDDADAFGFVLDPEARWARADAAHARALLRHAYEHRRETAELGASLQASLAERFAPEVVTSRLVQLLADAHERKRSTAGPVVR